VLNDRLANDVRRNGSHSSGTDDDRVLRALVRNEMCWLRYCIPSHVLRIQRNSYESLLLHRFHYDALSLSLSHKPSSAVDGYATCLRYRDSGPHVVSNDQQSTRDCSIPLFTNSVIIIVFAPNIPSTLRTHFSDCEATKADHR